MLQSNLPTDRARLAFREVELNQQSGENGIGDMLNMVRSLLRRQYPLILFTVAICLMLGATFLVVVPPTYTAHVQLLLGNPKTPFVQQQSLVAEPPVDMTMIDTQLQVMRSRAVIMAVIEQLKLDTDRGLRGSPRPPMFGRIRSWLTGEKEPSNAAADGSDQPSEQMIEAFQERLTATRVNVSNVIDIGFSWNNPVRAAEIANAVANAYITDQLNAKFEANKTATVWLQDRLQALADQADNAQRAVNAYKSQNNIVVSEGKPIDEQQIVDLNSRLTAARAQTAEAGVKFNRYESILKENPADSDSIGTLDAAGSEVLASTIITSLRQQYLEVSRRESEYAVRFGKNHLSVINLRNRMRDIRTSILAEVRRLTETARSDYENAKQRQDEIEKQLAQAVAVSRTTNSAEVTLRELQTKAKGYRDLYEVFLQRYMGSAQQQSFPTSEARIIYPASPPLKKSKPKSLVILALSLFGGLGLGCGLAFLRDLMDRVFRTPTQLEESLGVPCLSVVPQLQLTGSINPHTPSRSPTGEEPKLELVSRPSSLHWAVVHMPLSRFAESIRSIKLGIDLNLTQSSNKVIGITSTLPHEGKSSIAACLAQLIAHGGKRVIVIDCDLRNPSLSAALAPNAKIGLLDVLFGAQSIEQALWKDPKTNLVLLPVVKHRSMLHSSEMLTAEPMRQLFEKLRASYDYVIVDLPPLTPIVDARASSTLVDCFVYVIEWGRTKIDVVKHALHTAPTVYENIVGTVLNKTDIKRMASYDAYRSDYYNDSHYASYGVEDAG